MKKISLIAVIGILISMLAGCGQSALVGRWTDTNGGYFEFFSDGTYTSSESNYSGDYSTDGDRLRLSGVLVNDVTLSYKVKGNELIIYSEDGDMSKVFTKE